MSRADQRTTKGRHATADAPEPADSARRRYEAPVIVDLGELARAAAFCQGGHGESNIDCGGGNGATGLCGGGNAATYSG